MIHGIIQIIISGLAVFITAYLLPSAQVDSFFVAVVVALVLGIVNAIIKPILLILTLPITIITLGLFTFVINGLLILLVSSVVPGFEIGGFVSALIFSVVLSIVNYFLNALT